MDEPKVEMDLSPAEDENGPKTPNSLDRILGCLENFLESKIETSRFEESSKKDKEEKSSPCGLYDKISNAMSDIPNHFSKSKTDAFKPNNTGSTMASITHSKTLQNSYLVNPQGPYPNRASIQPTKQYFVRPERSSVRTSRTQMSDYSRDDGNLSKILKLNNSLFKLENLSREAEFDLVK